MVTGAAQSVRYSRCMSMKESTRHTGIPRASHFLRGLDQDRDAVRAALTLPYHNGGTEGVNTKTKRIMRQMRGRVGFALLRHRIPLA
ncbi:transposase [Streptosporangium sp. NPDC002544]|uniref:transposase n=1 Tax=Streptosporangium sp. NPDC002544 TaxID=3154538 RepID=UPI00333315AB